MSKLNLNIFGCVFEHIKTKLVLSLKSYFAQKINFSPNDSDAYNNLGVLNYDLQNLNQSLKDLTKAIKINTQFHHHIHFLNSAIHTYLGHVYLEKNFPKNAIEQYEKAVFQDHSNKEANTNKTDKYKYYLNVPLDFDLIQITNIKYKNPVFVLSKINRDLETSIYQLDFSYHKKYYQHTIDQAKQAYKKYKQEIFSYYIAASFFHLGKYKEATIYFSKLSDELRNNLSAQHDMSYCLIAIGKLKDAERLLRKLTNSQEDNDRFLFSLGLCFFLQKKFNLAQKTLHKSLKYISYNHSLYHHNSSIQFYNRAFIFDKIKEYDLAIADLNKSLDLEGNSQDSLLLRSKIYEKKNNLKFALEDTEKLLTIQPDNQEYINRKDYILSKLIN